MQIKQNVHVFFHPVNAVQKAIFVFDGTILDEVKRIAKNSTANKQIIFTGFIDWEKVQAFSGIGDIFSLLKESLSSVNLEFSKDFSIENYIDKTEKIYKKVLETYPMPITDEVLESSLL